MLSPLRNRFGIPGVISVIALVFAMLGGAYAASDNSGSGSKASASATKGPPGPRGKRGKPGPPGPAGPQGPAGPAGAKGDTGAKGDKGDTGNNGSAGAAGTSVTSKEFGIAGEEGKCVGTGGSKFTAGATKTFACNGKNGETGFTETLPSGKTETGNWSIVGYFGSGAPVPMGAISYSIPLAEPSENVVYLDQTETESSPSAPVEGCEYDLTDPAAMPVAPPGTLCIFTRQGEAGTFKFVGPGNSGDTPSGASLWVQPEALALEGLIGMVNLSGTWAVTAK